MKKFIGLVRIERLHMSGCDVGLKSRFYDTREEIEDWIVLMRAKYVLSPIRDFVHAIILENTEELNEFFSIYEDHTPVTEGEKEMALIVQKELQAMMKEDY